MGEFVIFQQNNALTHRARDTVWTVTFHKVVWQHVYGVVEIFIPILLEISSSFRQWINFENRLTFGKVIVKIQHHLVFWDTLYISPQ